MNKTVTINISGFVFHIEEDAFEKLSNYLKSIRGTFSDSDGKDEIMADIEARIAELLKNKLGTARQVVVMADVEEIINVMGRPEDYSDNAATGEKRAEQAEYGYTRGGRSRVFRDPDDKVLGGVCSGIAYYFGIDPIWLRIAFAVSFFCFGTGLLLYIILCLVIPKAQTTAEKLEMRGEKVNINNIKNSIYEDLDDLKKRAGNLKNEARNWKNSDKGRDFFSRLGYFFTEVLGSFIMVIGKIIAVLFIVFGIIFIIGLLGSVFGLGNLIHVTNDFGNHTEITSFSLADFLNVIFVNGTQVTLAMTGLLLALLVPLTMLVYKGVQILFNIPRRSRILNGTASLLFAAGVIILIYVGYTVGKDFSETANYRQTLTLESFASDTLFIKASDVGKYDFDNKDGYDTHVKLGNWNLVSINDKKINFGYPQLDVVESDIDSFQVVIIRSAKGATKKDAVARAKSIHYDFIQKDSLIEFNSFYDIIKDDKWRDQEVKVILKVPRNKMIYLSRNTEHIIYDIDNVTNTYDKDMVGRRWLMTDDGLECVDCEGLDEDRSERRFRKEFKHDMKLEKELREEHLNGIREQKEIIIKHEKE